MNDGDWQAALTAIDRLLALGALAFGVWAQLRVNDLESELDTARALDVLADAAAAVHPGRSENIPGAPELYGQR